MILSSQAWKGQCRTEKFRRRKIVTCDRKRFLSEAGKVWGILRRVVTGTLNPKP